MKKISLLLVLVMMLLCVVSCGQANQTNDINPNKVGLQSVEGLNEQILVKVAKPIEGDCKILYRAQGTEEYTELDRELMLEKDGVYSCYILGLPKGKYDVRVEQGEGESLATKTVLGVDVEKQDRSGYAHFNREEGVGGYNNDGSVKENAKIIYVSNATKNTVTLDVNGTTYTGLVAILQAKQYMEEPLIVRVLDTITTNQWKAKEQDMRPVADTPIPFEEYYTNEFESNGENLVGLSVQLADAYLGKRYDYVTTVDGLQLIGVTDITPNNTRDIGSAVVYLDYHDTNLLLLTDVSDITIEGVGVNAGFHQFGMKLTRSKSIELKNLTIFDFPKLAFTFHGIGANSPNINTYGYLWIHNNTFKVGQNNWVITGGGNGPVGDETLAFNSCHSITVSYNKFEGNIKGMLIGNGPSRSQRNFTIHHNHYLKVTQRLPLARHTNIHNYNNYFDDCSYGMSSRTRSYFFNEANYYGKIAAPYYQVGSEMAGAVKSYGDMYEDPVQAFTAEYVVKDREAYVPNMCMPDGETDYTHFDTDPNLFYYDAENKCTDVELLHKAEEVPEFVKTYAGAGVYVKMEIPTK